MSEPIVTFDEEAVRDELKELVRRTVEDTLNALLEEEADDLVKATDTSARPIARRTVRVTTSEASRPHQARSRSRCPSSRGCGSQPRS